MAEGKCIKTGAVVLFLNWGRVGPADLFAVGEQVIVRLNGEFFASTWSVHNEQPRPISHLVMILTGDFVDKQRGVMVVSPQSISPYEGA